MKVLQAGVSKKCKGFAQSIFIIHQTVHSCLADQLDSVCGPFRVAGGGLRLNPEP